jgi:hypothetical protein
LPVEFQSSVSKEVVVKRERPTVCELALDTEEQVVEKDHGRSVYAAQIDPPAGKGTVLNSERTEAPGAFDIIRMGVDVLSPGSVKIEVSESQIRNGRRVVIITTESFR